MPDDLPLHASSGICLSTKDDNGQQSATVAYRVSVAPRSVETRGRKRRILLMTGAVSILLAGTAIVLKNRIQSNAPSEGNAIVAPALVVTAVLPVRKNIVNQTELTGQFSAVSDVTLFAQVSGYLTEIHFQDGQLVRKGDLLFVIDPRPYQTQLEQAVGQYQTAAAALDLATKQLTRTIQLNHQQFASNELLDQRAEAQRAAAAAVQTAEATIHSTQLNLEFTRIVAPFSGRMSMRRVSIGSLISGGSSVATSTPLTSIVSVNPIHLDFDMSEADYVSYQHSIAQRAIGSETAVTVSLDGERPWSRTGLLDFIDNEVDRGSGTMHARATLDNVGVPIVPGQFARVRVPISLLRPELLVPDTAVITDQSTKMVMVARGDGTVEPKQVEVGASTNSGMRVVTLGLLPTDRVIIDGLMQLRPGSKVDAILAASPASSGP